MTEKEKEVYYDLPIKKYKREILYAVQNNDVVIVIAETGTGKTTQIPQFLIQAGYTMKKKIGIALPRRIACTTICKRVAQELMCYNGEVAYSIRFNSTVNENTQVKFLTDGMLLQQLYSDPLLNQYSIIMLDDIHQRSLNTDMLIGFMKKIIRKRKDLKIIISSATLDGEQLTKFFELYQDYKNEENNKLKIECVNISGRVFPVEIHYLKQPTKNYLLKAFQTIIYIDEERPKGDILVFLTSQEEIEAIVNLLENYCLIRKKKLNILPLFSNLSQQKQQKVFDTSIDRKIILSTNISQSSITLDGLYYVIDCGFVKIKVFDNQKSVQSLIVVPCGKSSARQRMGRAGRVKKGQCYRIYTEQAYQNMMQKLPPQILRIDLSNYILKLKGLGIGDITSFEVIDKPKQYSIIKAIQNLYAYQLINEFCQLSSYGEKVAEMSLDIKMAAMILNSFDLKFGCSEEMVILASMLSIQRNLFIGNVSPVTILKTKKKIGAKEGDFVTLINIFLRYKHAKTNEKRKFCNDNKIDYNTLEHANKIHSQLISQLKSFNRYKSQEEEMEDKYGGGLTRLKFDFKSSQDDIEPILRCILKGYFINIAQLQSDGSYKNIRSRQTLYLHPTSILTVVYPEWIVYYEIVKNNKYYIYNASKIELDWIFELCGNFYKDNRKQLANEKYDKQLEVLDKVPEKIEDKKLNLIKIGQQKIITQKGFNTKILGLKQKNSKLKALNKISIDEDLF